MGLCFVRARFRDTPPSAEVIKAELAHWYLPSEDFYVEVDVGEKWVDVSYFFGSIFDAYARKVLREHGGEFDSEYADPGGMFLAEVVSRPWRAWSWWRRTWFSLTCPTITYVRREELDQADRTGDQVGDGA